MLCLPASLLLLSPLLLVLTRPILAMVILGPNDMDGLVSLSLAILIASPSPLTRIGIEPILPGHEPDMLPLQYRYYSIYLGHCFEFTQYLPPWRETRNNISTTLDH